MQSGLSPRARLPARARSTKGPSWPEQTGRFLDFADEDRNYALWHLIALRGPRRGEAVALDRSEVDVSRATLTVRTSRRDEDDEHPDRLQLTGRDRDVTMTRRGEGVSGDV